ncbi:MAG: hypothetical protein QME16_08135, partial [Planctomycetota bacterium]|nr:hypothetical protein [Planctomycetota bacterium]
ALEADDTADDLLGGKVGYCRALEPVTPMLPARMRSGGHRGLLALIQHLSGPEIIGTPLRLRRMGVGLKTILPQMDTDKHRCHSRESRNPDI